MKKDTAKRPRINELEAVIGAVGMTVEELMDELSVKTGWQLVKKTGISRATAFACQRDGRLIYANKKLGIYFTLRAVQIGGIQ